MRMAVARHLLTILTLGAALARPTTLDAQDPADSTTSPSANPWSLDLTVHHWGLGIGNSRHVNGVRLNFRDHDRFLVNGINATVWTSVGDAEGMVNGIALGLPATDAREIRGLALGVAGVGANNSIDGVGIAPIGLGAGERLRGVIIAGIGGGTGGEVIGVGVGGIGLGSGRGLSGLMVGGLGVGSGGDVAGITLAGVGVGAGGTLRGISIAGVGVGGGGGVAGIALAGVGVGSGGALHGISVAGVGVGSGEGITGVAVGGVGVGSGGTISGLAIGGIGVGAGELLEGLTIAGVAAGAPRIRGVVLSPVAGSSNATGAFIAPAYFTIEREGQVTGVAVSAFNHIKGAQHGLTIGIFNYARNLHGAQVGVLNYAGNNRKGLRLLPLFNAHRD
jgi:hypothetical protein